MSTKLSSFSPVDGEVVWSGNATNNEEISDFVRRSASAGRRWRATSLEQRIQYARQYAEYLEANRDEITALLIREVGKVRWDAAGEVNASIAKIELSIKAIGQRRGEQVIDGATKESSILRRIRYQPLGVVLVLGPFNFPLHLPGGQIIPALLAGNTVIFKPSDKATAVGQWITEAWHKVGLPEDVLQMIVGGVETATCAIDATEIAGVFLTGSRAAGRAIHRQLSGRPDVLLALELGGHNPIVVTPEVEPSVVAKLVSFSAFISAGQRCTCARRALFVESDQSDAQIKALVKSTRHLQVGLPDTEPPPQIGPLIDSKAAEGLHQTYQQLISLGCKPLVEFEVDPRRSNLVRPAIVEADGLTADQIRQLDDMEWFGPLLVVQRVSSFDQAVESAAATPYGLAASLLGGDREMFNRFASDIGAGVVNWNSPTTGAAGTLPFGGLGDSGNHRPAGFFAIDFCSDPVASLEREAPLAEDPWNVAK